MFIVSVTFIFTASAHSKLLGSSKHSFHLRELKKNHTEQALVVGWMILQRDPVLDQICLLTFSAVWDKNFLDRESITCFPIVQVVFFLLIHGEYAGSLGSILFSLFDLVAQFMYTIP